MVLSIYLLVTCTYSRMPERVVNRQISGFQPRRPIRPWAGVLRRESALLGALLSAVRLHPASEHARPEGADKWPRTRSVYTWQSAGALTGSSCPSAQVHLRFQVHGSPQRPVETPWFRPVHVNEIRHIFWWQSQVRDCGFIICAQHDTN